MCVGRIYKEAGLSFLTGNNLNLCKYNNIQSSALLGVSCLYEFNTCPLLISIAINRKLSIFQNVQSNLITFQDCFQPENVARVVSLSLSGQCVPKPLTPPYESGTLDFGTQTKRNYHI